jgi:hypothetical protein
MQIGEVKESVEVTAVSPTVDTTTTTIGATLDSVTLSRLPVGRRFSDTLYLAPGVSTGGTVGVANPSIEGSSGLENQYVIDGVNITNGGYGALGSYSIVFGSLGNGTPYDFMQEVQVKTGGYEAEFGQATGGVINVVTKSGSNAVKGSGFAYARPHGLESTYDTVHSVEGTVNTVASTLADAGATLGGAVVRNHLFFFGAIDPQWESRTFRAPEGFPLETLGDVDRKRHVTNYAAKGTWEVSGKHRIDASFFGDPAKGDMGPQRSSALLKNSTDGYSSLEYGGHNQTVRYSGVMNSHFLVEASLGRALNNILETPAVNAWEVRDARVTPRLITGGIGFYEAGNRSNNWQVQAKATNILNGIGEHQVRYGFNYDHLDFDELVQYTGPTFIAPNGQQTATGAIIDVIPDPSFGQIYHVTLASLTSARPTTQGYGAFFVEDDWKIGNTLTVRPGVRYEQETLDGTLIQGFTLKNNWAPRVGVIWDPSGSGRGKVFGNFGRYYARVPSDLAARALSSDAGITADYFDENLTKPVPDGTVTTNARTGAGSAGSGPLPLDRPHDIKVYGSYDVRNRVNLSLGLELESGAPLTPFAAHPIYGGGGEIPLTVRGAGFQTSDGFRTRTPWTKPVNAEASYSFRAGGRDLRLIADVFNVFNTQTILDYNNFSEIEFGVPNADFGVAGASGVISGQQFATPRQLRVGVRYEF